MTAFAVHKAVYLAGFLYYMAVGCMLAAGVIYVSDMLERTYYYALPWGLILFRHYDISREMFWKYIGTVLLMAVSPPSCTIDEGQWFDLYQD